MKLRDSINKRIVELCEESNLSLNSLANMSGLPPTTLYSMFDGKCTNPSFKTIKTICDGLNINIREFFDDQLFEDLEIGF